MALRGKIPMNEGLYIGATRNGGRAILSVFNRQHGSDYCVVHKDAQATRDMAEALRRYSLPKFVSSIVWVPIPDPAGLAALLRLAEAAEDYAAAKDAFDRWFEPWNSTKGIGVRADYFNAQTRLKSALDAVREAK